MKFNAQGRAFALMAFAFFNSDGVFAESDSQSPSESKQSVISSWFDRAQFDQPIQLVSSEESDDEAGVYRIAQLQPGGSGPRASAPARRSSAQGRTPGSNRSSETTRRSRSPFASFTASRRTSALQAGAFISLAAVPYMIGDTASGSCASVSFRGGLDSTIEHPTLACSRLNISENNTALVLDRFYVSYRHFHNVSETSVFELENDLNVDRIMFGIEKSYFDGTFSVELRTPISRELSSNFGIIIDGANPDRDTLPLSDRSNEFGNISIIFKKMMVQTSRFVLSGGIAVQLPTADDVLARGDLSDRFFIVDDPAPGDPALDADVDLDFSVRIQNETVNISPFLAWLWAPTDRCFHQGFVQVDVPANPSDASGEFDGDIDPILVFPPDFGLPTIPVNVDSQGKLHQQTLLRLNLNAGYRFYQDPMATWLRSVSGMLELHYTTTLQDAKLIDTELFSYNYLGNPLPVNFTLGNGANRMDILNTATGFSMQIGNTTVTNGLVLPLSDGSNKAFDAEYNLQIQRQF